MKANKRYLIRYIGKMEVHYRIDSEIVDTFEMTVEHGTNYFLTPEEVGAYVAAFLNGLIPIVKE